MPTLYEAKGQARLLARYLESIGKSISHTQSLEAIARSQGAKSWNVFSAGLSQNTSKQKDCPPLKFSNVDWRYLEQAIDYALALEAKSILFHNSGNAGKIFFCINNERRVMADLSQDAIKQLFEEIANRFPRLVQGNSDTEPGQVDVNGKPAWILGEAFNTHGFGEKLIRVSLEKFCSLKTLGVTQHEDWERAITNGYGGLFIVGGVTRSGKSTTLSATRNLVKGVVERTAADETVSWHNLLSQDPDVLIVDDLYSAYVEVKSAWKAVKEALAMGRRVIASMHANSLNDVLFILNSQGLVPQGVLLQRLYPTICPHCEGRGCAHCFGQGREDYQLVSEFHEKAYGQNAIDFVMKPSPHSFAEDIRLKATQGVQFHPRVLSQFGMQ